MDLTVTAQVVTAVAQVAAQNGLSPVMLASLAGIVMSHVVRPLAAKIPDVVKPAVLAVGMGLSTAVTAVTQGVPVATALGYGLTSVGVSKLYHMVVFQNGGVLSFLNGAVKALSQVQPATGIETTDASPQVKP